jgi:hypothetical protein
LKLLEQFPCIDFFPRSSITLNYGIDAKTFPGKPRIHPIDRALPLDLDRRYQEFPVYVPCIYKKTKWIDDDGTGCAQTGRPGNSVLRLLGDGFEVRILHFRKEEMSEEFRALMIQELPAFPGDPIGPAGNKGLSIGLNGHSGRHIHYELILEPGKYDDDLTEKYGGLEWKKDYLPAYVNEYGSKLELDRLRRRVSWMNSQVIARIDPGYGKLMYSVNSYKLLGL